LVSHPPRPTLFPYTTLFRSLLPGPADVGSKGRVAAGTAKPAVESVIRRMRNRVAHPSSYHLLSPVESARSIRDTAEIINYLWGSDRKSTRLNSSHEWISYAV